MDSMEKNTKKLANIFSTKLLRARESRVLLLAVMVVLAAVFGGMHVNASDSSTASVPIKTQTLTAENLLADNDDLLEGYLEQLFETEDNDSSTAGSSVLQGSATQKSTVQTQVQATTRQIYSDRIISADAGLLGTAGEAHLNDVSLAVYNELKSAVAQIASGEVNSSVVNMYISYTYEELGVDNVNSAATVFVSNYSASYIFEYLLLDCPYELYWFDKTAGVSITGGSYTGKDSVFTINLVWSFAVSEDYQAGDAYTVDASKVKAANTAVDTAKKIISTYANKTDREKLTAYKDEICALVSYEENYSSNSYGDVWELIYVFDGDDSTNVVCEGYAKAFQYLCDLSTFDDAVCYTVEGTMSGGIGAGGHMWNLVCLNGINCMADITNSDEDTIGEEGGLFLVCADDATTSSASGYSFTISKTTITYAYSSTTLLLYEESIRTLGNRNLIVGYTLKLGTTSYTYDGTAKQPTVTVTSSDGSTILVNGTDYEVTYSNNTNAGTATVTVTGTGDYSGTLTGTFTINAQSISSYKVSLSTTTYTYDGTAKKPTVTVKNSAGTKTLTSGTDYTVSYTNNTNAGTATVTVTGTGNYTGTLTTTFTINKASQTVTATAGSTSITVGGTTTVTAKTTGDGAITFSSSDTKVATVSSTGVVTTVTSGTVTITATAAATTNYNSASASVTITINNLSSCSVSYINNTMYGLKVVWGKVTGASGYYVYIRNDDKTYNSTPTATVVGGDTTEWTDTRELTGGKDYTYKVAAYYESSDGTITVGSSGTTKTCKYLKWGVVESVTNTASGPKVTWTKVAGANGYYIFRKAASDSDYTQVATVTGTSVVSWTDTSSLKSGTSYTYKVSAIFTNSKGQVTKGGALTTKSVKYLTAGTISSLTNTSSGITVKWSKVTGATGYYVYRKASSASSYTLVKTITSVGTTSYSDTSVKSSNNTTYTYYIQPYFKNSSGAITKAGYTTKSIVRLVAPTISSLTNSSSKTLTVKWGTKSGVTGYEIQYSTSSSFASGNKTVTVTGSSSSSKAISSLTKGKTYYVRIRTYKTVSGTKYYSAWSTAKSVKISK